MASGSFGVSTSNKYIYGTLSWSEWGSDIGSNGSYVYYELRFSRTNSGYTTSGTGNFYIKINGEQKNHTGVRFTFTQNSNTLVASGSVWVPHNPDGSKQVLIETWGDADTPLTINYANSSPWLDTIPRASTYTGNIDWTAGTDNLWITIDSKSSSFHHTVQMFVQHTYDSAWDFIGERTWFGTSGWFNPSVGEITQIYRTINMYENRPCKMRVYTYDANGKQVGDYQDKDGTVRAYATGVAAFNDFNIGTKTIPATIQNWAKEFQYDVTMTFGSFTKNIGRVTSSSFNITLTDADVDAMYQQIPNANSGTGTVTVRTKYNEVLIEDGIPTTHDKTFTAYVVNQNPVFSTIEYHDTNATITALTGNDQYIVQNKSTVQAKILNANKAVGQKYATITKYVAILNGVSNTVTAPFDTDIIFNFNPITTNLNINLTITAYDSRGNATTVTKQVNVVPYNNPVVQTQALRDSGFGSNVTLTLSGSISPLNINGVDKNSLVSTGVNYKWRQLPAGAWSANIQFLGQTLTMPNYTTTPVSLTMDTTLTYEIVVQVTDKIGNTTVTLQVAVGTPIMFIDDVLKSVGIGKFPSKSNVLDFKGEILSDGYYIQPMQSYRDFSNGTLIQTDIAFGSGDGDPWLLEITGNSYGSKLPFDIKVQGYIYQGAIINYGGSATGTGLTGLVAFSYNSKLCFWFPRQAYWQGFNVVCNSSWQGVTRNLVTSITDSVKPSGVTREVSILIQKSMLIRADDTSISISGTNLNTLTTTGFWRGENLGNAPYNSNLAGSWFYIEVISHEDTGYVLQKATDFFTDRTFYRRRHNWEWLPWRTLTSENGSNSNGTYTKVDDGTLICRGKRSGLTAGTGIQAISVTYPYTFTDYPSLVITLESYSGHFADWYAYNPAPNGYTLYWNSAYDLSPNQFHWVAVGRWN